MKETFAELPKHKGSVTVIELAPLTFGNVPIVKLSEIEPALTVDEHNDVAFVTEEIEIVVLPALVSAADGIVKVAVPEDTTTPLAIWDEVFDPVKL